jgi:hypothetical protein
LLKQPTSKIPDVSPSSRHWSGLGALTNSEKRHRRRKLA